MVTSTKSTPLDAVRRVFTESAEDYSKLFLDRKTGKNFLFRKRLNISVELARRFSGRMLDTSTGSGEIAAAILAGRRFTHATLLDISPRMIELARQQISNVTAPAISTPVDYECEDIFHLAHRGSELTFDLILCLGLIAHTGRLDDLLLSVKPRLAPGGGILLQSTLLDHLGSRIERVISEERFYRRHGYHINYFSHQDIVGACARCGLQIVELRRHSLGIPFGDRISPLLNYYLERLMSAFAGRFGSEAIYLLQLPSHA